MIQTPNASMTPSPSALEAESAHASHTEATQRRRLRQACRANRRSLSSEAQEAHARSAHRVLLGSGLLHAQRRICAYFADDGELDPEPLVARLHQINIDVAFPVIVKRAKRPTLRFRFLKPGDSIERNSMGIWEPAKVSRHSLPAWSLSMMLVPLVAFDTLGTRLGRGGGYYDAYLSKLGHRRGLLVGFAHECQRVEHIPRAPWDVPLDAVITERSMYLISQRAKRFGR